MTARTTLNLDSNVLAEAKRLAQRTNRTLTAVVDEALREAVLRANRASEELPVVGELFTIGYSKLNPEIDFSNNALLREMMDEEDGYTGR